MANKVNNWEQQLELANKDLKQHGVEMNVILVDETGGYNLHIIYPDGTTDFFAENYYEDELGDLINDATALYNNDENHSAESGVFSSEKRAMEWLEKQAKQWKEDQGIDDEDFELRIESRKVNAYDSGTSLYSFEGTVGEAYMDNPEGPLTDVLKRNQKIINKRKGN